MKRGCFQSELWYALACASRIALDAIYFLPVGFEKCEVPARITRHLQYVNLFSRLGRGSARSGSGDAGANCQDRRALSSSLLTVYRNGAMFI